MKDEDEEGDKRRRQGRWRKKWLYFVATFSCRFFKLINGVNSKQTEGHFGHFLKHTRQNELSKR